MKTKIEMKYKGFTLIELLVVVLIIGILAAIAVPQYQKAVERSRLAEALSMGNTIEKALAIYVLENGYPANTTQLLGDNSSLSMEYPAAKSWGNKITYTNLASSRYFTYSAACGSNYCDWQATRRNTEGEIMYTLFTRISSTKTKACSIFNNDTTGTQICALLQKEGYKLKNTSN